jgi:hypothetical protein
MNKMICAGSPECGDPGCDHYGPHEHERDCDSDCSGVEGADAVVCVSVKSDSPQDMIAANTAERGYRSGRTAEQFAARQVCKLAEELGELAVSFRLPRVKFGDLASLEWHLAGLAGVARAAFDHAGYSRHQPVKHEKYSDRAKNELADIQVVVFNLAQALSEITGEPFDVVQAAVEKSAADVERGVR